MTFRRTGCTKNGRKTEHNGMGMGKKTYGGDRRRTRRKRERKDRRTKRRTTHKMNMKNKTEATL